MNRITAFLSALAICTGMLFASGAWADDDSGMVTCKVVGRDIKVDASSTEDDCSDGATMPCDRGMRCDACLSCLLDEGHKIVHIQQTGTGVDSADVSGDVSKAGRLIYVTADDD